MILLVFIFNYTDVKNWFFTLFKNHCKLQKCLFLVFSKKIQNNPNNFLFTSYKSFSIVIQIETLSKHSDYFILNAHVKKNVRKLSVKCVWFRIEMKPFEIWFDFKENVSFDWTSIQC